jgi:hypothetical protein
VCQFLHSSTTVHLAVVKRILRYIKTSTNLGLKIRKKKSTLVSAFSDAGPEIQMTGGPLEGLLFF